MSRKRWPPQQKLIGVRRRVDLKLTRKNFDDLDAEMAEAKKEFSRAALACLQRDFDMVKKVGAALTRVDAARAALQAIAEGRHGTKPDF